MQLYRKTIPLTDDLNVIVCEADASYDARFAQAVTESEKVVSEDRVFVFFYKTFYPLLSACVVGTPPTVAEAYALPHTVLDAWYSGAWELNPDILGPLKEVHTEEIEFRDGSSIVVYESHDLPSFILRLVKLENEAQDRTDTPADEVSFRQYIYPKIAACVNGSKIPTADEAIAWPRVEIAKWSSVAMKLNPNWFQLIFDEAAKLAESADVKKKTRKRRLRNK